MNIKALEGNLRLIIMKYKTRSNRELGNVPSIEPDKSFSTCS